MSGSSYKRSKENLKTVLYFCNKWVMDALHRLICSKVMISYSYKKLGYVFYMFCICFVYIFKKSTVFIRNWSIFHINYTFLIIRFLYVFKNLIKNVEFLKTYTKYIQNI